MNPKLTADRLRRRGIVYVRQSSPGQVVHNQESQRRQYGLADHARQLCLVFGNAEQSRIHEQRAAGQRWIACVTEGNGSPPVTGTVRDAFTGGRLPNSYAVCADDLTAASSIPCADPHRAELFASTGVSYHLPGVAELNRSCGEFVRYLTGRKDVSADGRLQVAVAPVYYGITGHKSPRVLDAVQIQPAQAFCGVRTTGSSVLIP